MKNCENNQLKKQLIDNDYEFSAQLVSNLNCLSIKSQLNMISEIIENSTNMETILFFFSKVNNFINFFDSK